MRNKSDTSESHETCLVCNLPVKKRGLCSKHYEQFRRAKNELPMGVRADFESTAIAEGLILEVNLRPKKKQDRFAQLADTFRESPSLLPSADEEDRDADLAKARIQKAAGDRKMKQESAARKEKSQKKKAGGQ